MKKILLALTIVVLMSFCACAEEPTHIMTNTLMNGRGFDFSETYSEPYTIGCIQTLNVIDSKRMHSLYPYCTIDDILQAVKIFYKNNPTLKHLPVITVLRNGCKQP
jgi:hypothetical protein